MGYIFRYKEKMRKREEDFEEWKRDFDERNRKEREAKNNRKTFCPFPQIVSITESRYCVKDKCQYWIHTGFGSMQCEKIWLGKK